MRPVLCWRHGHENRTGFACCTLLVLTVASGTLGQVYRDAISREWTAHVNDLTYPPVTDAISQELVTYIGTQPLRPQVDGWSHEFTSFVDAAGRGQTDTLSREFVTYVGTQPLRPQVDAASREFTAFREYLVPAITDSVVREFTAYVGTQPLRVQTDAVAREITTLIGEFCDAGHGRYYVDARATGARTGGSWTDAFTELEAALAVAKACTAFPAREIWVAAGVYRPSKTGFRNARFELTRDVAVYGGFAGHESQRDQRDPSVHLTILSGDLAGNDGPAFANRDDNSHHVVSMSLPADGACRLDGFVIEGGNAGMGGLGGGIVSEGGSATISNCLVRDNEAGGGGGVMLAGGWLHCENASFEGNRATQSSGGAVHGRSAASGGWMTFLNSRFIGNSSQGAGGAVHSEDTTLKLFNCLLNGNQAGGIGGGVASVNEQKSAEIRLLNCTITHNRSGELGGGLAMEGVASERLMANCILWRNEDDEGFTLASQIRATTGPLPIISHCLVEGWTSTLSGDHSSGAEPLFIDPLGPDDLAGTLDDNLRLAAGSPAIDTGDADLWPVTWTIDLDGQPRIVGCHLDRGAYESPMSPSTYSLDDDCDVDEIDLSVFAACATGPALWYAMDQLPADCPLVPDAAGLMPADYDGDADVDLDDFAVLQRAYTGQLSIP